MELGIVLKVIVFKILGLIAGAKISRALGTAPLETIAFCIIFGHLLDLIASKKVTDFRIKLIQRKMHAAFVKEHIIGTFYQILGKLCVVDGKISEAEKVKAREIAKVVFKLSNREADQAVASMNKTANFHLQSKALRFFELYSNSPQMLKTCCQVAFDLAIADGKICAEEEKFLKEISIFWGIDEKEFNNLLASYTSKKSTPTVSKSYEILGCNENDSDQDIKKKYRTLVTKYHPDKIQSKELPEDFVVFANQKFQSIQQAYEEIMSLRTSKVR